MDDHPRRGDVFFAFLDPVLGCEQGGTRPVLVVQNDAGNRRSKTIIVAAITGKPKANLHVHVPVPASAGLREGSVALLEQLRTIDKLRLRGRAGHIGAEQMRLVDAALAVSLGLKGPGDDFMLLTLCRKCHQTFCDSDDYLVWRADFEQEQREPCTICNTSTGYDYNVVRRCPRGLSSLVKHAMRKIASFRALPKWLIMSVARRRRLTTRRFAGPTLAGCSCPRSNRTPT